MFGFSKGGVQQCLPFSFEEHEQIIGGIEICQIMQNNAELSSRKLLKSHVLVQVKSIPP